MQNLIYFRFKSLIPGIFELTMPLQLCAGKDHSVGQFLLYVATKVK